MREKSGREIELKKENRVLYEPPEPLFSNTVPRMMPKYRRLIALALFLCIAASVLVIVVSGKRDGSDGGGMFGGRDETESEEYGGESDKTEEGSLLQETEGDEDDRESMSYDAETEGEEHSNAEIVTEQDESEWMTDPEIEIVELDLSRAEEGENTVVNYSDKVIDISGLGDRGFVYSEKKGSGAPLVMVIHTHTSEKYLGGDAPSVFDSVVAVGDELNTRLNSFGLTSLHCTVIHDGDGTNAYLNARETIETMLRIYPSIKYVIDLHRLELEAERAIVKTWSGSSDGSAQIRLTVSSSCAGWQEDLSLALALRARLNRDGSRVCMPTVISPSRYNSDLSEFYIMADIGALGNSVREAKAAAVRLADAMCRIILEE